MACKSNKSSTSYNLYNAARGTSCGNKKVFTLYQNTIRCSYLLLVQLHLKYVSDHGNIIFSLSTHKMNNMAAFDLACQILEWYTRKYIVNGHLFFYYYLSVSDKASDGYNIIDNQKLIGMKLTNWFGQYLFLRKKNLSFFFLKI